MKNENKNMADELREQKERNNKILAATRKLRQLNSDYRKKISELEGMICEIQRHCGMLIENLSNSNYTMNQNDKAYEELALSNQYLAGQLEVYKKVYGEIDKK